MLFCLVNLVYNIFFYILLHNIASVNNGPHTRHRVPAAALRNFFLFLLKYPLHFTSYFLNCILLKIVHCVQKTNNAFFYRQIQKWLYWHLPSKTNQFFFFQTLNLLWHVSHPYCFGMCPIYSRLSSQFLRKTCLI